MVIDLDFLTRIIKTQCQSPSCLGTPLRRNVMPIESHPPLLKPIQPGDLDLPSVGNINANVDFEIDWPKVYGATSPGFADYPPLQSVAT
ncbi:hypothetical protein [Cupriavidus oxalaticus]|uniref:hypothetical protein n=1 Tax=Cupriavidus oxalaticus TaxID=96344 RepID=UPI0031783817